MEIKRFTRYYISAVIAAGAISLGYAVANFPLARVDLYLGLLFIFTVAVGSRISVRIPRFKSHISVSDTFIFLALLLFGGEAAIILAAVEAFASSWRFCNKKLTVFFNSAAMAVSTFSVVLVLKAFGLYSGAEFHGFSENTQNFFAALTVIAMTAFIVNTSIASVYDSLKQSAPLWETWKNKYIWSSFTYFVGALGAGALVQLSEFIGLNVIVASIPVIFFIFLSYRMYLKNVEMSMQQAETAEEYARLLESQSDALRDSEERFRSAFEYAPIGIGLLSPEGQWLKVNPALIHILGYTEDDFLSRDFQSMTHEDDVKETCVNIRKLLNGEIANCQAEQRYIHKTGRTVWASWSGSAASDPNSAKGNLIFQIQDISARKAAEERLQHEATHDELTGLPNRAYFLNKLSKALAELDRGSDKNVCILFIDLDRFKYVNDSLGHLVGDKLLSGIADRLRDCMRPHDLVARLGGDEFTVMVEGPNPEREITRIAERIQQKLSMPFDLDGHEVFTTASIGILHASENHKTAEDMMRDADTAMYQAKRAGKARHEVFNEEMHREAKEILTLETDLRRAIERDEIRVYYQPIYSLSSGRIEGLESLSRWHHPTLGDIPPSKFIPLAEEIGLIDDLCARVLRRACRDIAVLKRDIAQGTELSLSVNLSCRQFAKGALVQNVKAILDETDFCPFDLKIEITESVFVEHPERAIEMLDQLREMGIEIYVDDFGTGYSNLAYLMKLPISTLKIDRSFVSMIEPENNNSEIVRAIVTLARNLGLKVIAEGIETPTQLEALLRLECESGQGFIFAEPMKFSDLRRFLIDGNEVELSDPNFEGLPMVVAIQ